jgi:hypothetical protein
MTYEHLWTLFQPGHFIFSKQQGQDRIFKLVSSKYGHDRNGNPVFWLTCQYVDYDGTRFGTQKLNLKIPAFDGTKSITSLSSYPLDHHNAKDELKKKLLDRGTKIENFAGCYYRSYNGIGWRYDHMGNKDSHFVKGRIVIDVSTPVTCKQGKCSLTPTADIWLEPIQPELQCLRPDSPHQRHTTRQWLRQLRSQFRRL